MVYVDSIYRQASPKANPNPQRRTYLQLNHLRVRELKIRFEADDVKLLSHTKRDLFKTVTVCTHTHTHTHTHAPSHKHTHTHMQARMQRHTNTHTHTHAGTHAQTHKHTHAHANTNTHTHTHTQTQKTCELWSRSLFIDINKQTYGPSLLTSLTTLPPPPLFCSFSV